jgi:hypothetical protein
MDRALVASQVPGVIPPRERSGLGELQLLGVPPINGPMNKFTEPGYSDDGRFYWDGHRWTSARAGGFEGEPPLVNRQETQQDGLQGWQVCLWSTCLLGTSLPIFLMFLQTPDPYGDSPPTTYLAQAILLGILVSFPVYVFLSMPVSKWIGRRDGRVPKAGWAAPLLMVAVFVGMVIVDAAFEPSTSRSPSERCIGDQCDTQRRVRECETAAHFLAKETGRPVGDVDSFCGNDW